MKTLPINDADRLMLKLSAHEQTIVYLASKLTDAEDQVAAVAENRELIAERLDEARKDIEAARAAGNRDHFETRKQIEALEQTIASMRSVRVAEEGERLHVAFLVERFRTILGLIPDATDDSVLSAALGRLIGFLDAEQAKKFKRVRPAVKQSRKAAR